MVQIVRLALAVIKSKIIMEYQSNTLHSSQLMQGKKGIVVGVANDHSIAWGISHTLHQHGAELILTYQNDAMAKRVIPLAESINAKATIPFDASQEDDYARLVTDIKKNWSEIDFCVHAIAYSDKEELKAGYINTSLDNFLHTMHVSCYSFTKLAAVTSPIMRENGSYLTLTYDGSNRVMPQYNVMGVAKAALESSVRYLACDLGNKHIRVNALSPGPMRTLAGSAIGGARATFKWQGASAPLRHNSDLQDVSNSALYLLSDLSSGVTGGIHYADCGYHVIGMAIPFKE